MSMNRRTFGKLAIGATGLLSAPTILTRNAWAQGKEIQVGIWGGAQGEYVRSSIVPQFEADFGCTVITEEGFTLANVEKMRATRTNPQFSVMFIDDVAIPIARDEGLIAELPLDQMPASEMLFDRFNFGGYGTGLAISVASLFHNTGITPPDSYGDLWDPKWAGKIKLVSPKNTPSVFFLIVAAALKTGKPFAEAQYEIGNAFDKVAELKPNVLNIFDNGPVAVGEVAQGQADIGFLELSKYVYPYTAQGAPVTMSFPKEGSFAGNNSQVLVKGGPNQDLSIAFMNRMLEADTQKAFSEFALTAPPVGGIEFSEEASKYMVYPDAAMDAAGLFTPDWEYVNANRSAWTEELNGIFSV